MKVICTICARGGSKGVLGKNTRVIAGLPLIAHTITQALEAKCFEVVAVSSDDDDILRVATESGASTLVIRPFELAQDTSSKLPAIRHCVAVVEQKIGTCDVVVDLDVTSPLRSIKDITDAISVLLTTGCDNVITATPARRSPYFNMVEQDRNSLLRVVKEPPTAVVRRQDAPPTFDMNASIYVWRRDSLLENDQIIHPGTRLLQMPAERSHDIDTELDFEIVEFLLKRRAIR